MDCGSGGSLRRATPGALAFVLMVGIGTASAAVNGKVIVTSDPAGAMVLADGVQQGATPVELTLAPGEHRIELVKGGYLNNRRRMAVAPNESRSLRVALTALAPPIEESAQTEETERAGATAQAQGTPQAKGSKKKWLLIGAGAVAAGGATYVLTRNGAPEPGTITVSPEGTGMAEVTSFAFSSNATDDKDGESELRYEWDFGDGASGSGRTTTHVYDYVGSYSVKLTVTDSGGKSASAAAPVTVAHSLTGTFVGRIPGIANTVTLRLTQTNGRISGTETWGPPMDLTGAQLSCSGYCVFPISGSADTSYPAAVSFSGALGGAIPHSFNGASADENAISGTSTWSYPTYGLGRTGMSTFTRQ